MQGITIELMKQHSSTAYRVFNCVELFFSFEGVLTLELNGKETHFYHQIAIVNHNDIINVKDAQAVVKISIPLHYFSKYEPQCLLGFFSHHKLSSHNKIKAQIKKVITEHQEKEKYDLFVPIIKTLVAECFVATGKVSIPRIQGKSILFNNIMDYVHEKPYARLSLTELSEHFFVSESYISTLFNKFLGYTFKKYFVSLKVGLSIYQLLHTNESINQIALDYDFSSYNHYSKQFKRFSGVSPITFRKQTQNVTATVNIAPFDFHYFEGHLTHHHEQTHQPHAINIYLNQIQKTQYIQPKVLLLEIEKMTEMNQIFTSLHDNGVPHSDDIALYFNTSTNQAIMFEHIHEIELLCKLILQQHYQVAYHITSIQNYERFKTHFFYPLIEMLQQSQIHNASQLLKLNIVLEDTVLTSQEVQLIMHEMKTINESCQFTFLITKPFQQKTALYRHMHFDYFMLDVQQYQQSQDNQKSSLQMGNSFHHQIAEWIKTEELQGQPILLTGLIAWMLKQPQHISLTERLLDIWLKMHETIQGVSIPLISKKSAVGGYFTPLGHQTSFQHIFHLMRPFNNVSCVIEHSYVIHESMTAYDILLFHPLHTSETLDDLTYQLYGTLKLNQHFVVEYMYHPKYSNIEHILTESVKDYYLPSHYDSMIHSTNQLLFNIQLHHFGLSRYQTTVPTGGIKLIHIAKNQIYPQNEILPNED